MFMLLIVHFKFPLLVYIGIHSMHILLFKGGRGILCYHYLIAIFCYFHNAKTCYNMKQIIISQYKCIMIFIKTNFRIALE